MSEYVLPSGVVAHSNGAGVFTLTRNFLGAADILQLGREVLANPELSAAALRQVYGDFPTMRGAQEPVREEWSHGYGRDVEG